MRSGHLPFQDIVKVDTQTRKREVYHVAQGVIGEPVFAPRTPYPQSVSPNETEEDDGAFEVGENVRESIVQWNWTALALYCMTVQAT